MRNPTREKITNTAIFSVLVIYFALTFFMVWRTEEDIRNRLDMLQTASNKCRTLRSAPCTFEQMLEEKLIAVHPHTYPGSTSYSIDRGVVQFRQQQAPHVKPIQ